MPKSRPKIYKEAKEFDCHWESAASWIQKGYRIVELTKRGGSVYVKLSKD